ncbi:hypothetical protein NE686_00150 [Tissierella carlieri]|uniref:BclA C-terminal domain-containing protein n=1 Tax=Tissierella carlieri TaxID=689904 RepID=A0ABT1S4T8_9FIRM|nr:hypothetical protein [Tissierella carlieri]MCQ4921478.1 hypothetical protein [Tissierella carlieri]
MEDNNGFIQKIQECYDENIQSNSYIIPRDFINKSIDYNCNRWVRPCPCRCRCHCHCRRWPWWMDCPEDLGEAVTADSMFAANASGATIAVAPGGTLVPLPDAQNLDGFIPNGTNTLFMVPETGRYYITYNIDFTVAVAVGSRVTVNGNPLAGSNIQPLLGTQYNASLIANLRDGDTVGLELFGLLGAAVLRSGVGASLNIIRLS